MNEDHPAHALPAVLTSRALVRTPTLNQPSIILPGLGDQAAERLAGSLIYVASDFPRVGRDTLSALLIALLENRGVPCVLINVDASPGPANYTSSSTVNLLPLGVGEDDFIREFGRAVVRESNATIVVNIAPIANELMWMAEERLARIIEQQGRALLLFWLMERGQREYAGLEKYRQQGGRACSSLAGRGDLMARLAEGLLDIGGEGGSDLLFIPELPPSVQDAFHARHKPLTAALAEADVVERAMLEPYWLLFLNSVSAVLS